VAPETLAAEIDLAIVLVGQEIVNYATLKMFGSEYKNTGTLPDRIYIAGVLALTVLSSFIDQAKEEGHVAPQDLGLSVMSTLLIGRQWTEINAVYNRAHQQLIQLAESKHPKAKEWLETVIQLALYYVMDETTRKDAREKHLFAQLLTSLVDAAE
jgi:hypothetical protein